MALAVIAAAEPSSAAPPAIARGGDPKKIGLVTFETRGVAPQLVRRLRRTITDTLSSEGLRALDLIDTRGFIADCHDTNRCMIAALKQSELDYVLLARLTPLAPSHNGSASKPEQQLVVSLGRTPAPASAWGPWRMSTTCLDCSDSDLADATQQLVVRAWKAMTKAETPPQNIKVTRQDRSDKGAKLLSAAHDENLSAFDQIYLLKKAIQAGAGRRAFLDLAQAFYDCQGYQEAEDYLAKAAAEGADVDFLLGPVLWFSGRSIDAQPVFERLALASPNDEQLQHALAEVRRRGQDYHGVLWQAEAELARGDAIQAIELGRIALAAGRGTRAHLVLGKASAALHDDAGALAEFMAVLDDDPDNATALAGEKAAAESLRRLRELRAPQ